MTKVFQLYSKFRKHLPVLKSDPVFLVGELQVPRKEEQEGVGPGFSEETFIQNPLMGSMVVDKG